MPFTWNLSPLRPSKFSFEYLLLPPRSAPTAARARARAQGFAATAVPSYSYGLGACPDGRVSALLGTVTRLPVHPALPVLLTKNGPLGALDSVARLNGAATPFYLFKASTRVSFGFAPLRHSSPSFGSRQACSHSNPSQKIKVGRRCNPRGDPVSQLPCTLRVYSPVDSLTCQTPWSVFHDGPNGELAGRHRERADAEARPRAGAASHDRGEGVSAGFSTARALTSAPIRTGPRPESIGGPAGRRSTFDRGASLAPIHFPPDNFKHSMTLISKSGHDGALTLSGTPFQGTGTQSTAEDASPDYNSNDGVARFSSWALPGSLAVTRGILVSFFSSAY
ncbi:hypothetical protein TEA_006786 [Camellia sinensis var. sinensis]|uniref:Uncharacterized protein n=1 Tax=Camellia sinensis var. sinensis TaxID=542762 RepID=A0A4S4D6X0_CAMSN|nr:hypothetical protein TEA_006786 [Camellia sinensis var. sinensis]